MKVIKRLHNSKGTCNYVGNTPIKYFLINLIKRIPNQFEIGFPRLLTHGQIEEKGLNYMIITKFDADIEYMFTQAKRKFSLQTIITIGILMLEILEKFHSLGYVHNDMKPQNIMTKLPSSGAGGSQQSQLFLIDFGLTMSMSDHSKYKFKGTPYFASNSALQRIGTGAKDDIESLIYILIYFYNGELPWQRDLPVLKDDIMSNMQI